MDIKICISSTNTFSHHTYPVIVPSLIKSGVYPSDIFFIEGGHQKRDVRIVDGVNYITTTNNSFDLTGLIDVVENSLQAEYWFVLHDTCRVGRNFYSLVCNIPNTYEKIALKQWPSMSIGSYKNTYIEKYKDRLLRAKNIDYSESGLQRCKNWYVENEDYMLWGEKDTPCTIYNKHLHINENFVIVNELPWYNSDTTRRVEYYPQLDLYKSKANWHTKSIWEVKV